MSKSFTKDKNSFPLNQDKAVKKSFLDATIFSLNPNSITVSRIFLAPVFLFFLIAIPQKSVLFRLLSFVFFILLALTDILDGYLARKKGQISDFGKCFDHIADKVLNVLVLLALVSVNKVSVLPAAIIILREIIMSGTREFLGVIKSETIPVTRLSKNKTIMQYIAISILLLAARKDGLLMFIGTFTLWVASALSIITLVQHLRVAMSKLK